jgi:hypothetical protein
LRFVPVDSADEVLRTVLEPAAAREEAREDRPALQ